MQQLFPTPAPDVDPAELYAGDHRPARDDRPWVMLNMITSVDGGISVDGVSGGLGAPADKLVFSAIRAVADVILVGAGTVIAENYRRPQTSEQIQDRRTERGQTALPRLAIVSNRLSIEPDHRVFDPDAPPIVITAATAPPDRRRRIDAVADVLECGDTHVDIGQALEQLRSRAAVVLAEGGPSLNGTLLEAGCIDEVCLSLSPTLLGGDGPRLAAGAAPLDPPGGLALERVLEGDGITFHRYVRTA